MSVTELDVLLTSSLSDVKKSFRDGTLSKDQRWSFKRNSVLFVGANFLHVLAFGGLVSQCKWIMHNQKEITPETVDDNKRNVFHYLAIAANSPDVNYTNLESCFQLFIKKYITAINAADDEGNTPLHYLATSHATKLQLQFIANFAKVTTNKAGETPMKRALKAQGKTNDDSEHNDDQNENPIIQLDTWISVDFSSAFFTLEKEQRFSISTAHYLALIIKFCSSMEHFSTEIVDAILKRWKIKSIESTISENEEVSGYVMIADKYMIVAFSRSLPLGILENLSFSSIDEDLSLVWYQIEKVIKANSKTEEEESEDRVIYTCGNAVGGALATLSMIRLEAQGYDPNKLHMYTFGQTRVANVPTQQQFDQKFPFAYTVVKEGDRFVNYPPIAAPYVGGYHHCGTLRLITTTGQLYNDKHYQFQDVRRRFIPSGSSDNAQGDDIYASAPIIQQFRIHWTKGLQQIQQQDDEQPVLPAEENLSATLAHNLLINAKHHRVWNQNQNQNQHQHKQKHERMEISNLDDYINDLLKLTSLINAPLHYSAPEPSLADSVLDVGMPSAEEEEEEEAILRPDNTITVQRTTIHAPSDLWDERIKGVRHQVESESALLAWIANYSQGLPPPYNFTVSASSDDLLLWFEQEREVLILVQSKIEELYHSVKKASIIIPSKVNLTEPKILSSLVEVSFLEFVHLLFSTVPQHEQQWRILKELYFQLPSKGYKLQTLQNPKSPRERQYELAVISKSSSYRVGLIRCLENYTQVQNIETKLHTNLESLPYPSGVRPSMHPHTVAWQESLEALFEPSKVPLSSSNEEMETVPSIFILGDDGVMGGPIKDSVLSLMLEQRKKVITVFQSRQVRSRASAFKAKIKSKVKPDKKEDDEHGNESEHVYGRRLVWSFDVPSTSKSGEYDSFFVKEYPELPGLERASYLLSTLVVGEGIPPSCVGRIVIPDAGTYRFKGSHKHRFKRTEKIEQTKLISIPILISKAIKGWNLQDVIGSTKVIHHLDADRFSRLFLLTLLTLVEDGKPDNFLVEKISSSRSDAKKDDEGSWLLSSVDNDHILVPPFLKSGKLNMKSILFCMDQMNQPLDPFVVEQYLLLNLEELLLRWLVRLDFEDRLTISEENPSALFHVNQAKMLGGCKTSWGEKFTTILRPVFEKRMVHQMYVRMRSIQTLWRMHSTPSDKGGEDLTHFTTLSHVLPEVAAAYKAQFARFPLPLERFISVTSFAYDTGNMLLGTGPKSPRDILGTSPVGGLLVPESRSIKTKSTSKELFNAQQLNFKEIIQQPLLQDYSPHKQIQSFSKWVQVHDGDMTAFKPLVAAFERQKKRHVFEQFNLLGLPMREYFLRECFKQLLRDIIDQSKRQFWQQAMIQYVKSSSDWTRLDFDSFEYLDDASLNKILQRNSTLEELYLMNCHGISYVGLPKSRIQLPSLYKLDLTHIQSLKGVYISIPNIKFIYTDPLPNICGLSLQMPLPQVNLCILGEYLNNSKIELWKNFLANILQQPPEQSLSLSGSSDSARGSRTSMTSCEYLLHGAEIHVNLFDITGQEASLKRSSLSNINCFILLFRNDDASSFQQLKEKWVDVREYFQDVPCVVCNLEAADTADDDLSSSGSVENLMQYHIHRQSSILKAVSEEEAIAFTKSIAATCYLTCSDDFPCSDIQRLFESAIAYGVQSRYDLPVLPAFASPYFTRCYVASSSATRPNPIIAPYQ